MLIRTGRRGVAALALALAPGLAACAGGEGTTAEQERPRRYVVITHGQSADPFWSVVANGVADAAEALGVDAQYQAPGRFSMVEMADLIEAAVASRPEGIAVSIPDADALGAAVRSALERGIHVVSLNSGSEVFGDLGIGAHVGQPDYEAGLRAGERMAGEGVRRALCVNHEVGNLSLDDRCRGFGDALARAGGASRAVAVELADPADTEERIAGALEDPSVDGLLTLGPAALGPALAALRRRERRPRVAFATFDLSSEALDALERGELLFAVDQQPYLQGYLAVVSLVTATRTGTMPVGVVRTGPALVTAADVERVRSATARGLR